MKLDSTVIPQRLMVLEKAALPNELGFSYGARAVSRTGALHGGQMLFHSLIDHPLGSVVERTPIPLDASSIRATMAESEPARKGPTAKDREQTLDRGGKVLVRGGVVLLATEIVNAGGAVTAAPLIAKLSDLPTDTATVDALAKSIEKVTVAAPGSDVWRIVKLAILLLTLVGLTPSVIRYIWGDHEPRWAWPVAYALNIAIVVTFGLWMFGAWPFNAAPGQPAT